MADSSISNISTATGSVTSALTGASTLGKEEFLNLLVTQFQYQDPLNPMEDTQFIAQLAQFSALEQQMATNESMEKLVTLQQQSQMISAVSYIGREVSARGYGITVADGGETVTSLDYALSSSSASTYVNIYDASNRLITTINLGAKAAGQHSFTEWDGTDAYGNKVPDGTYTFYLVARDADGNPVETDTNVTGIVKGVTIYDGNQILVFDDGRMVELSNVREVMKESGTSDDAADDEDAGAATDEADDDASAGTVAADDAAASDNTEASESADASGGDSDAAASA